MGRVEGMNVVITGATGGQGRVACRRFCSEGARVLGSDIDAAKGRELEEELRGDGHDFSFVAVDLLSSGGCDRLAEAASAEFGHVDVLYNNHGLLEPHPLLETTEEQWDRINDTDLKSVFLLIRGIAPLMQEPEHASIINVGSIASLTGLADMAAYCAAKTGLIGLTRAAAIDLAKQGTRVNLICPGMIDTPMSRGVVGEADDPEEAWTQFEAGHLVDRAGTPEEVVGLALFLASEEATFITGASIAVDGGWSVR